MLGPAVGGRMVEWWCRKRRDTVKKVRKG